MALNKKKHKSANDHKIFIHKTFQNIIHIDVNSKDKFEFP